MSPRGAPRQRGLRLWIEWTLSSSEAGRGMPVCCGSPVVATLTVCRSDEGCAKPTRTDESDGSGSASAGSGPAEKSASLGRPEWRETRVERQRALQPGSALVDIAVSQGDRPSVIQQERLLGP